MYQLHVNEALTILEANNQRKQTGFETVCDDDFVMHVVWVILLEFSLSCEALLFLVTGCE